jgi:P pilus assembly chaperone PapD
MANLEGRRVLMAAVGGVAFAVASAACAQVGADLNITPKRIVAETASRTATVYIFNRGTAPATYAIGLVDRAMTPDGQIRPVDEVAKTPGGGQIVGALQSAAQLIIFTPRRVTLVGGDSQTVRIRFLRPGDLKVGEYRTHLTVTTLPPEDVGLTADQAAAKLGQGQLSMRVTPLFSLSIPVIVRQGPPDVRAAIGQIAVRVEDAGPGSHAPGGREARLSLDLVRQGASSLYGDVEVRAINGAKNAPPIGGVRGVAVYTEVASRTIAVPLTRIPAAGERLMITFRDDDTRPGAVLATAAFTAP